MSGSSSQIATPLSVLSASCLLSWRRSELRWLRGSEDEETIGSPSAVRDAKSTSRIVPIARRQEQISPDAVEPHQSDVPECARKRIGERLERLRIEQREAAIRSVRDDLTRRADGHIHVPGDGPGDLVAGRDVECDESVVREHGHQLRAVGRDTKRENRVREIEARIGRSPVGSDRAHMPVPVPEDRTGSARDRQRSRRQDVEGDGVPGTRRWCATS